MAKVAKQCASMVAHALYNAPEPQRIDVHDHGKYLVWDLWGLGLTDFPQLHDVCIMLGADRPESVGLDGGYYTFNTPLFNRYHKCVVINGLSEVDVTAVTSLVNRAQFIEVCSHEFMHLFDGLRSPLILGRKAPSGSGDQRAYYNDPAEFNAYYHDLVSAWTAIAVHARSGQAGDYAELYGFTGDFKADLGSLEHTTISTSLFLTWLTDARSKALLRRAYKLHRHVAELLAQEAGRGADTPPQAAMRRAA